MEAAIGKEDAAAAFEKMKKDDQIAAAMVLRGMAKEGQFALKNADDHDAHKGTVKNAVESATNAAKEAAVVVVIIKLGILLRVLLLQQKVVMRRVLRGLLRG
ncbi:variable large family protein [Borreliella valaisiana]|uniref:variable large family protein n=1 Tax=Borreliella valaisiana TaxID=62088 RepID=UPI003B21AC3A